MQEKLAKETNSNNMNRKMFKRREKERLALYLTPNLRT